MAKLNVSFRNLAKEPETSVPTPKKAECISIYKADPSTLLMSLYSEKNMEQKYTLLIECKVVNVKTVSIYTSNTDRASWSNRDVNSYLNKLYFYKLHLTLSQGRLL